jgi:hypothetical protein
MKYKLIFLQDAAKKKSTTNVPAFVDADIIDKAKEAYAKADACY